MNELVFIKRGDVFTDTWIIAQKVEYSHRTVTKHIKTYQKRFNALGGTYYTQSVKSRGGRDIKPIALNETQAVFLMTLLGNSEKVLNFKQALSIEFVRMRRLLLERQTTDWQQARLESKDFRKILNSTIKELVPYAVAQGSAHPNKLYEVYAKLIKGLLGYDSLDMTSAETLSTVTMLCRVLRGILLQEMARDIYYKIIYQTAKARLTELATLMNTPRLTA